MTKCAERNVTRDSVYWEMLQTQQANSLSYFFNKLMALHHPRLPHAHRRLVAYAAIKR